MAINKVIYGGNTLIDLTGDTVPVTFFFKLNTHLLYYRHGKDTHFFRTRKEILQEFCEMGNVSSENMKVRIYFNRFLLLFSSSTCIC